MSNKKVYLINFGSDLSENIIKQIEEKNSLEIEEVRIKASLNLRKHSTMIQIHDLVSANRKYFTGEEKFIVNLPGLPIFSAFLITEIHALTGDFPVVLECVKEYDGGNVFSNYVYKRLYDLSRERQQSRENYKSTGQKDD